VQAIVRQKKLANSCANSEDAESRIEPSPKKGGKRKRKGQEEEGTGSSNLHLPTEEGKINAEPRRGKNKTAGSTETRDGGKDAAGVELDEWGWPKGTAVVIDLLRVCTGVCAYVRFSFFSSSPHGALLLLACFIASQQQR
jgi:hypothetical protein